MASAKGSLSHLRLSRCRCARKTGVSYRTQIYYNKLPQNLGDVARLGNSLMKLAESLHHLAGRLEFRQSASDRITATAKLLDAQE